MKCSVCNREFELLAENKYVVTKLSLKEIRKKGYIKDVFDAFDCPFCGCQLIAGNRYLNISNIENDTLVTIKNDSKLCDKY